MNLLNGECSHSAKFKKITDIYISIARAFAVNVETVVHCPRIKLIRKFRFSCQMLVKMVPMEIGSLGRVRGEICLGLIVFLAGPRMLHRV